MYIFGGVNEEKGYSNLVYSFNFEEEEWRCLGGSKKVYPRAYHSAVESNGIMYVFGGKVSESKFSNKLFTYLIEDNAWTETITTNKPPSCYMHNSFLKNDILYVFGGKKKKTTSSGYIYGIETPKINKHNFFEIKEKPSPRQSKKTGKFESFVEAHSDSESEGTYRSSQNDISDEEEETKPKKKKTSSKNKILDSINERDWMKQSLSQRIGTFEDSKNTIRISRELLSSSEEDDDQEEQVSHQKLKHKNLSKHLGIPSLNSKSGEVLGIIPKRTSSKIDSGPKSVREAIKMEKVLRPSEEKTSKNQENSPVLEKFFSIKDFTEEFDDEEENNEEEKEEDEKEDIKIVKKEKEKKEEKLVSKPVPSSLSRESNSVVSNKLKTIGRDFMKKEKNDMQNIWKYFLKNVAHSNSQNLPSERRQNLSVPDLTLSSESSIWTKHQKELIKKKIDFIENFKKEETLEDNRIINWISFFKKTIEENDTEKENERLKQLVKEAELKKNNFEW